MSCYLTIKKDGKVIGSWSRSNKLYRAFDNRAPFDAEEEFEPEKEFRMAREDLDYDINKIKEENNVLEKIIDKLHTVDELVKVYDSLSENKEELEELMRARYYVDFMEDCYNASKYDEDEENKWTWGLG